MLRLCRVQGNGGFSRAGESLYHRHRSLQLGTARPGSTSGQSTSGPPGWVSGCRSYRAVGRPGALQADRLRPACPALSGGVGGRAAQGCVWFCFTLAPADFKHLQLGGDQQRVSERGTRAHAGSMQKGTRWFVMKQFGQKIAAVFWFPGGQERQPEEGSRETQLWQQAGLCS